MKIQLQKLGLYAPALNRIGMSIVFLWFGVNQLIHPEFFIVWLPAEVQYIPIKPETFVFLNGGFEVIFGVQLFLGVFTRISSLLLGLHLAGITYTIGLSEVGIRDFGLTLATLTIFLTPIDRLTIDYLLKKKAIKPELALDQKTPLKIN